MSASFDKERCEKRNRQAALRFGIETAHINFLNAANENAPIEFRNYGGTLPETVDEALKLINSLLPENAEPLAATDVYIHYVEAANNDLIRDRFCFLSRNTLRLVARDAAAGAAFMNTHRTGGMSTDAEFPFGKTFAGLYQEGRDAQGNLVQRAHLGLYMLRNIKPNGDNGPSTDDLDKKIRGGTLFDVSVGLKEGTRICDVCEKDLTESDCPHVPGTHYAMDDAEIAAQLALGVPEGRATYTYENGRLSEISGVFDGAVRGAGFRKAMSLATKLKGENLKQARDVYSGLLSKKDEELMNETILERVAEFLTERFPSVFGDKSTSTNPPAPEAGTKPDATPVRTEENSEMSTNNFDVEKLRRDSEELAALKTQQRKQASKDFATEQVAKNRTLLPFGHDKLQSLHEQLSIDDSLNPLSQGSRVEELKALFAAIPGHNLTSERAAGKLPEGSTVLNNDPPNAEETEIKRSEDSARKFAEQRNATGPRAAAPSNK
jgi:hypothetical protein